MINARRLTLLNTGILTDYGTFRYAPLTLDEARGLIKKFVAEGKEVISAIGHKSTAELLSDVLEYQIAAPRPSFKQSTEDAALVFKLKSRPAEGAILTRAELERTGYEFALLTRIA